MSKSEKLSKDEEVMRKILERLNELRELAKEEDELVNSNSEDLFLDFVKSHLNLGNPLLSLTPDNYISASWIDAESRLAIKFCPEKAVTVVFKKDGWLHLEIPVEIFQKIT